MGQTLCRIVMEVHRKGPLEPRKIADLVDTHLVVVVDMDCVKELGHHIALEAGCCTGLEDTDLVEELPAALPRTHVHHHFHRGRIAPVAWHESDFF